MANCARMRQSGAGSARLPQAGHRHWRITPMLPHPPPCPPPPPALAGWLSGGGGFAGCFIRGSPSEYCSCNCLRSGPRRQGRLRPASDDILGASRFVSEAVYQRSEYADLQCGDQCKGSRAFAASRSMVEIGHPNPAFLARPETRYRIGLCYAGMIITKFERSKKIILNFISIN